jgi:probable F420-dependent oxidoreductase
MKISVEFPSVAYREGPAQVARLAQAVEEIGYDDLAVFDHVVMAYELEGRHRPRYPAQMPVLEALVMLGFVAAVTSRVSLSTEVLVLPQRQAALVAKQVATIDLLSAGRVRLGIGVGWQEPEYAALGVDFGRRGRLMDEAIEFMRECWTEPRIDHAGTAFRAEAVAMEPKPRGGAGLPLWIGGTTPAAFRRTGRVGAGWMGMLSGDPGTDRASIAAIRSAAEEAGRDPTTIGLQAMLAPPPRDADGKTFYADHDRVVRRALDAADLGFDWIALNATAIFQAGARSVAEIVEQLAQLHGRLRAELGSPS